MMPSCANSVQHPNIPAHFISREVYMLGPDNYIVQLVLLVVSTALPFANYACCHINKR